MNSTEKQVIITSSTEETQKVGEELAKHLRGGETIALYGELGSGKTAFVQGLAQGLGIKRRIISPTFIIVRSYGIRNNPFGRLRTREAGVKNFYHIDLYRIDDKTETQVLGIEEIIKDPQNIVAIEWAEKIQDMLPKERIDVYFEFISEYERRIRIRY